MSPKGVLTMGREVTMDAIAADIMTRLRTLEWLVGLSMAWNTLLTGVLVGIVLKLGGQR
jgi:hypothetical protein